MAKNSIRDYSATAASNTDIQSVDIDENCAASGINNALREIMVDLKNVSTGAVNLETPAADSLTVDGSITIADKVIHSGDTDTFIEFNSANNIRFVTNNTAKINIQESAVVVNEASNDIDFRVESNTDTHAFFVNAGDSRVNMGTTGSLQSASTASSGWTWQGNYMVSCSNGDTACILNRTSSVGSIAQFRYNGAGKGGIVVSTSGTTYNTTSDRRLKTDIQPIADATDKLMQMQPVTHKWIAEPDGDAVHGFIAQEMQQICPEAVSGEDGGEEMMSMDYGRITPVLVAALQDAHRKIEELEQRLSKMEN